MWLYYLFTLLLSQNSEHKTFCKLGSDNRGILMARLTSPADTIRDAQRGRRLSQTGAIRDANTRGGST